jgi:hypothetical protein
MLKTVMFTALAITAVSAVEAAAASLPLTSSPAPVTGSSWCMAVADHTAIAVRMAAAEPAGSMAPISLLVAAPLAGMSDHTAAVAGATDKTPVSLGGQSCPVQRPTFFRLSIQWEITPHGGPILCD